MIVEGHDAEPSVGGLVQAFERVEAQLCRVESLGTEHVTGGRAHDVRQVRHRRVELRVLDVPAGAGAPANEERHEDRGRAEQPVARVLVADRRQRRVELPRDLVGDADVTGHHRREALPLAVRTARSPSGRVQVHDARVDRMHARPVEPEPLGGAGSQVVVHDVGPLEQLLDRRPELRILQVGRERPLAGLRGEERPLDAAQRVAARGLELDHVGAEVGEQPRRVRPRVVRPEVEHLDPVEQRPTVRNLAPHLRREAASSAVC